MKTIIKICLALALAVVSFYCTVNGLVESTYVMVVWQWQAVEMWQSVGLAAVYLAVGCVTFVMAGSLLVPERKKTATG